MLVHPNLARLVVLLVLGLSCAVLAGETQVLVHRELAEAGVAGSEDGESDDDTCDSIHEYFVKSN